MTNQSDLNKDFVSMFRDLVDDIHKIKKIEKAVDYLCSDILRRFNIINFMSH